MDGLTVAFLGRLGQDAELKWTQNGTPLVNASVLVQDSKAADGQSTWVRVGHFGDAAENLAQQLVKGTECYVEGLLKLNTWQAADGTPRSGLNVTAWKLEVVGAAAIGRRPGQRRPSNAPRLLASARRGQAGDPSDVA